MSGGSKGGMKRKAGDDGESSVMMYEDESPNVIAERDMPGPSEPNVVARDVDEEDEIFKMLDNIVNRKIERAEVLDMNVIYKLVDIYLLNVKNRGVPVGGLQKDGFDHTPIYIWLPQMLFRNFNDNNLQSMIDTLSEKIRQKKYAYISYRGKGVNLSGHHFHDIIWFNKRA